MDDTRRSALTAELSAALKKRDQLDAVIEYLSEALGVEPPPRGGGAVDIPDAASAAPNDPLAAVSEGEFFGLSGPKATKLLMEKFGRERPLKTDEIFAAIKKGGVNVQSKEGLYRSLFRDPKFTKVGTSLWGLSAWYPAGARKAAKAAAEEEAKVLGLHDDAADDDAVDPESSAGVA